MLQGVTDSLVRMGLERKPFSLESFQIAKPVEHTSNLVVGLGQTGRLAVPAKPLLQVLGDRIDSRASTKTSLEFRILQAQKVRYAVCDIWKG